MNEGKKAQKTLNELKKLIYESKPTIRSDYVIGFYRLWTRLPALERVLIKKGILTQEEVDKVQTKMLRHCKKDFQ